MRAIDWIIAAAVVLIAAAAVFFAVRKRRRGGCCGDCGRCGSACTCEKNDVSMQKKC